MSVGGWVRESGVSAFRVVFTGRSVEVLAVQGRSASAANVDKKGRLPAQRQIASGSLWRLGRERLTLDSSTLCDETIGGQGADLRRRWPRPTFPLS